jgi:hypothetical protein
VFQADSLLNAFATYLSWNGFSVDWVAGIAAAFRHAGGDGALVRLPDAAIKASLRAAGLDHHRRSVTFDEPSALGFPATTGYTDDPVNTATGNFVLLEEDVVCSGLVDPSRQGRSARDIEPTDGHEVLRVRPPCRTSESIESRPAQASRAGKDTEPNRLIT